MSRIEKSKLLDLAKVAVADRGLNYGKPEDNFAQIAVLWNAYLLHRTVQHVDALDVSLLMILMKVARLRHSRGHLDSWVDIAGYAACGANIACEEP